MEITTSRLLFILAFALLVLLAFILLKPFTLHRKRPISTFFLKSTYLVYLTAALSMTFIFLFNFGKSGSFFEDINNPRASAHFIILMVTLVVPSVGLFIRRKFKKREIYNIVFTTINLLCLAYYLLLIKIAFKLEL
jgi:hypothetical protein